MIVYTDRQKFKEAYKLTVCTEKPFHPEMIRKEVRDFLESHAQWLESIYYQSQLFQYGNLSEIMATALYEGFMTGWNEKTRAVATANSNRSKALKSSKPKEPPQE